MVRLTALAMGCGWLLACAGGESAEPPNQQTPCVEGWNAGICLGDQAGEDCADFSTEAVAQQAESWSMAMADLCGTQYTFDQDDSAASAQFIECFIVGYDEVYVDYDCD